MGGHLTLSSGAFIAAPRRGFPGPTDLLSLSHTLQGRTRRSNRKEEMEPRKKNRKSGKKSEAQNGRKRVKENGVKYEKRKGKRKAQMYEAK